MARGNKKIVEQVHDLFNKANGHSRKKWEGISQQSYEFFLGEQLTEEEQDELSSAGMPNFIVNRITPVIEMMKFFATANTPRWQAVGAEGSDADVAAVHADIADYCWYNSNGDSIYAQIIQDALVKGIGYMQIDVDPDQDRGLGEVVFKRIEPFDVYTDPTSRDFLFRDSSYIIIRKDLPREQLIRLFPEKKRQIKSANSDYAGESDYSGRDALETKLIFPADSSDAYTKEGEEDLVLNYYECYSKEKITYMNIFVNTPPGPTEMEEIKKQVEVELKDFEAEMMVRVEEKSLQLSDSVQKGEIIEERAQLELERAQREAQESIEQQKLVLMSKIQEAQSRIENYAITEIEYDIMMKNQIIADTVVDAIKFYDTKIKLTIVAGDKLLYDEMLPIKEYPIVPFVYQYTGTPYPISAVYPLVGKQQELNKAHQILIHNANLASNLRWMYEEGSVPEEEWERYSSAPGALLKYRQGFTPPTPVQPMPLNNAFYSITQNARSDMEYVAGIYSSMQGDTGASPETYRGLLQMDEYGTRRIKAWMQNIVEPSLEHLGMIFKDWAQDTYLAHKVFRIVQPNNIDEEKIVEINVPIFDDLGNSVKKWNDYATARFDVRIIGGSTLPLNRWALLEEYFKWYQSGLIDDIAMLQETDVRNKESVIKRKSVYMQLRNKLEELESIVKDRNGTIETLERQLVQSGIKQKVQSADISIQKDVMESEAAQSAFREKLKGETAIKMKELGMAIGSMKDRATTAKK